MIDDNYFDASLLMRGSNIAMQMYQDEFLKLNFENKVGLLIAKITNEALEDNNIKFLDVSDRYVFAGISLFHHWTSVLIFGYLKKHNKELNKDWGAKSFLNFFTLNKNFDTKYLSEQYTTTNKQLIRLFKDAEKDKSANEITESYSILVSSFVKHKGLNYKKEIDFRDIFKNHLQGCLEMLDPE